MDERFVYYDRNGSKQYYSPTGQVVAGVTRSENGLCEISSEAAERIIGFQPQQSIVLPEKSATPPGLEEGGLWYKQYIRGNRKRMIYRPDPLGMEFYDKEGRRVNLFEGPVEPPVTMVSLL